MYDKVQKEKFKTRYQDCYKDIPAVKDLIAMVSTANFNGTLAYFQKNYPDSVVFKALNDTVFKLSAMNATAILLDMSSKTEQFIHVKRLVTKFRSRFYCTICDPNASLYIDVKSKTVTYSKDFCKALQDEAFPVLSFHYNTTYSYLKLVNNLVFLATNLTLFQSLDHFWQVNRIQAITSNCTGGQSSDCPDFCKEYKFNEASMLFDCDQDVIGPFLKNFNDVFKKLTGDSPSEDAFAQRVKDLKSNPSPALPNSSAELQSMLAGGNLTGTNGTAGASNVTVPPNASATNARLLLLENHLDTAQQSGPDSFYFDDFVNDNGRLLSEELVSPEMQWGRGNKPVFLYRKQHGRDSRRLQVVSKLTELKTRSLDNFGLYETPCGQADELSQNGNKSCIALENQKG